MDSKIIFIVGVGRSGTTLIQGMLNAHPKIAFAPETHFVKKYIVPQLSGNLKKFSSKSTLYDHLKDDEDLKRIDADLKALIENHVDLQDPTYMARLFYQLLLSHASGKDVLFVGDKDPMNIVYLEHLKKVYPEAYLLHIIRDPRDVILSRIKSDWGKDTSFFLHVAEYQHHIKEALNDGKTLFGEHYIEVFYENLLSNSEDQLKRVCISLGLDYDPAMMKYHETSRDLIFENEMSWKKNVFQPVIRNNVAKWKKELTRTQVAKIEGGIEDIMLVLGYPLSGYGNWFARNILSLPIVMASWAFKIKKNREAVR